MSKTHKKAHRSHSAISGLTSRATAQPLGHRTKFAYDGLGRLRERAEYVYPNPGSGPLLPSPGTNWVLVSAAEYIYDGFRVIQERDANNNPLVSYTRGTDLSAALQGANGIGGLLARSSGYSLGNWTAHAYYHADGNGNITYLETSTQGLAASYRYDSFGKILSSSGTLATANVYRFSSKEYMTNSSMYYFGYRFYDPNLPRWINRDPLTEPGFEAARNSVPMLFRRFLPTCEAWQGPNLYSYSQNDPLNRYDPLGLALPGFKPPRHAPPCFRPGPINEKDCINGCIAMTGACLLGSAFVPPPLGQAAMLDCITIGMSCIAACKAANM